MRISEDRRHLAAAVALMVISAACRGGSPNASDAQKEGEPLKIGAKHAEERVEIPREAVKRASIEAVTVAAQAMVEEIRSTAIVRPNEYRLAHVGPRIPGKAVEVRALLGASVEPGQVLCELDSLELGEKKSAFLQSRTSLEVARRNYEREERLFKQADLFGEGVPGSQGRVRAQRRRVSGRARGASTARHLRRRDRPMSWGGKGRAAVPLPAAGALRRHDHRAAPDHRRARQAGGRSVHDCRSRHALDPLDVYEKQLPRIAVGTDAEVAFDAYPGERFAGRIAYLAHVLDDKTRTSPARIEIDNRDGRLRPGMFATATIASPAVDARRGSSFHPMPHSANPRRPRRLRRGSRRPRTSSAS